MITNKLFPIILLLLTICITSCEKEADIPELSITASPSTVAVGEEVTFSITGDAETYAIYTGDTGHEFEKSHLVWTEGEDVDLEEVVLVSDSLEVFTPWLQDRIIAYNDQAVIFNENLANDTTIEESEKQYRNIVNMDFVFSELDKIVDVVYTNKDTPKYLIGSVILPEIPDVSIDIVDDYFEDNSVLLAPEGGFSRGFPVDRYLRELKYTYNTAGSYVVTVIGTNVSDKIYEGSGYRDDRTSSASEYDIAREYREIIITVND